MKNNYAINKLILFLVDQGVKANYQRSPDGLSLVLNDSKNLQFFHEYLHFDLFGVDENDVTSLCC